MANFRKNLLYTPHISPLWIVLASGFWCVLLYFAGKTRPAEEFAARVARPFIFRVREALERTPKLHPRVKIFGIDDRVVSMRKSSNLSVPEWARLIAAIDAVNPAAILVDGMFSEDSTPPELSDEVAKLMRGVKAPVIVGSFAAKTKIAARPPLDLRSEDYALRRWFAKNEITRADLALLHRQKLPSFDPEQVYGPHPSNRRLFNHIGHFQYDQNSVFYPFFYSEAFKLLYPHFALFSDTNARFDGEQFRFHGHPMPIGEGGFVHINFSARSDYWGKNGRVRSMWALLEDARKKGTVDGIAPGDYVLLLPAMFTGNTDFKISPMGYVPGGLIHATILSNALSGEWLKPLQGEVWILAGACLVGGVVGAFNGPVAFAALLIFLQLLWFAVCTYLHVFHNIATMGHIPAIGLMLTAVTAFTERMRVAEMKRLVLKSALDGLVAPNNLREIMRQPDAEFLEAREEVVTIMFIDVVGFSVMSEHQIPRLAFDSLKTLINDLSDTVHQHGGVVNKTLGDGLLCCFGRVFDSGPGVSDHAEQAVRCAVAIQKANLPRNVVAAEADESIYPLRIGINTASVFLGDLGRGDRIDISLVGNGVNFAKRLEGACDMHSVLISKTTRDLLSAGVLDAQGLKRKLINIKHHAELVEAFEYDPFYDQEVQRQHATQLFRQNLSQARAEDRWQFGGSGHIHLETSVGAGELLDFSATGLRVNLPQLMTRGSVVYMDLKASDEKMATRLAEADLLRIEAEVRWSYEDKSGSVHGLAFRDLSADRCELLTKILRNLAIFVGLLCNSGCLTTHSAHLDSAPAFAYLSWDEVANDRPDVVLAAVDANAALDADPLFRKLPLEIRRDRELSRLVLDRSLENPQPFDLGAIGKINHALYFVATADRIQSQDRFYWTIVKALSERYGCFMRHKSREGGALRFRCRDGRRVVFWSRQNNVSAEFYARQFDALGRELVVTNHRISARKVDGLHHAMSRSLFDDF